MSGINDETLENPNHKEDSVSHSRSSNNISSSSGSSQQQSLKELNGHHKGCQKPFGKHYSPKLKDAKEEKRPMIQKGSKPVFVTVTHGIQKSKKVRHYKCKNCGYVSDSQAETNKHYRKTHPPVKSLSCDQSFNNPSTQQKHKYNHLCNRLCNRGN